MMWVLVFVFKGFKKYEILKNAVSTTEKHLSHIELDVLFGSEELSVLFCF